MQRPTPEQQDAIEYDGGNLLILACAGSGKTETMARRIAMMISRGAARDSIVAFTFTEHAASELKQRIRTKLEEIVPDEPALGDMYVGTIHSFCLRLLRESDAQYRKFEVMDEARQAALIATNFVRFDDSDSGIGLDRLRGRTRSKTHGETLRTFLNTLNVLHQQQIDPSTLSIPALRDAVYAYKEIAHGYPNFFFDFNKIIDEVITCLESRPELLEEWRSRLTHVFVDEYQDVDDRQERLIGLLTNNGTGPFLTVVGDDDQALYGFRGASVRNILTFQERYPNVKEVKFEQNFRSTHAIVSIADEAVRKIPVRIDKQPVARKVLQDGELTERMAEIGDVQLRTFPSEEEEADWVADRILELRGVAHEEKSGNRRGLDYGDMAILLRSVKNSGALFAERLRDRGIPAVISGAGGLFDNEEIKLVQAAFSLLARADFAQLDENNRIVLLSTTETREFVREKIASLKQDMKLGSQANSTHFLSWVDATRADLDQRSVRKEERKRGKGARIYPQAIFHEMLNELGSAEDAWQSDTLFNFGAFSDLLSQFEAVHQWITPSRLKSLVLFLSNWAAKNVDEGGLSDAAASNSVQIMTVHAAKGLEWPIVFLPRISSYIFPSSMKNRGPEVFLPKGSFDDTVYIGGDDGERRLWYVALTRCAKYLHVSSLDRARKRPTSYFKEIEHDCVVRHDGIVRELDRLPPTPPVGSEDLPTTYSDLSTYWRCEREYQFRALMSFSPGVGEQFGYGQQLHHILAEIHQRAINGDVLSAEQIDDLVEERFHLRYTRNEPFDALKDAAKRSLLRYMSKAGSEVLKAHAVEKQFEFVSGGALISGVVDLLERGELELPPSEREIVGLVDFKAKRISRENYNEIKQAAEDQLRLYAAGVHYGLSKTPGNAVAHIVAPRDLPKELSDLQERIEVDVSEEARAEVLGKVSSTVEAIRNSIETNEFRCSGVQNGACKRCDFRVFCNGYKDFKRAAITPEPSTNPFDDREAEVDELIEDMNAGEEPQRR